jgi:hypothetical protein
MINEFKHCEPYKVQTDDGLDEIIIIGDVGGWNIGLCVRNAKYVLIGERVNVEAEISEYHVKSEFDGDLNRVIEDANRWIRSRYR